MSAPSKYTIRVFELGTGKFQADIIAERARWDPDTDREPPTFTSRSRERALARARRWVGRAVEQQRRAAAKLVHSEDVEP